MHSTKPDLSQVLKPGLSYELPFVAEGELLTTVEGTLLKPVLSTPSMIGRMERAATRCIGSSLPRGFATVGFEVQVRHIAVAAAGTECVARAELQKVAEGRKLRFAVEVLAAGQTVGVGSHERRVVMVA